MNKKLVLALSAEELVKTTGGYRDPRSIEQILGDADGTQGPTDWKEIMKCY